MPGITNWSEALLDPRFWVCRYAVDLSLATALFGVSYEECDDYGLNTILGHGGASDLAHEQLEGQVGSCLTIPFPENYTWTMQFTQEGILHKILHPRTYPNGALIAEESGHAQLPGLRWSEVKQMVACLQREWTGMFDIRAMYPLLYPVVSQITFEDLDDVRQTLYAAWDILHCLGHPSSMSG
jgi:hypothetical protein